MPGSFVNPARSSIKIKIPKPRNPSHAILASKPGGAHRKSNKALRSQAKADIQSKLETGKFSGLFFRPRFQASAALS